MRPYTKLKLQNVLFVTLTWVILGILIAYYNHYIGKSIEELEYQSYDLETNIITNVISTFIAGLFGGTILIFFLKDKFRKKPLGISIIIYVMSIMAIIIALSVIAYTFYFWFYEGPSTFQEDFYFNLKQYLGTNTFWLNMVTWTLIATLTIIVLQINDKYGQGVFFNLLLGKYHRPKYEKRIFMFMDMRSSTEIAEELGHRNYFSMLNEIIELITEPIVNSEGEIYQYVGDEVVVTWLMERQSSEANAIKCFFAIRDLIREKADYFKGKYAYVPHFKAGIHCGDVTTGEIGTYKKEIVFTGDTVNTTARIQEKCSELGERILASEHLYNYMKECTPYYTFREISEMNLKGKKEIVKLYAIDKVIHSVTT
ncbi:MAG: adenylate/guanylate cyclase domain-containing protein [Candidatus Cyclobacteriaceae bacterium M2_1C_046]